MRVLIIEDEIPAAEKLERYLNKYDPFLEILATLGSVKKSVNWFTTSDIFPDLIFMDIRMPGIDGVETFLKIKEMNPDCVVVMMKLWSRPLGIACQGDHAILCLYYAS